MEKLQSVSGMNDVLPDESCKWEFFEETVTKIARQYGYCNMRVPLKANLTYNGGACREA